MLRLHLSLAAARSATVNGAGLGTGQILPRAPGAPLPPRFSPICGGESMLRRGSLAGGEAEARRKCTENGRGGSVPGEKGEGDSMVKKGQSPSGRSCADAEETQADESDHSGYDTAAGYSDFYESYSECAESPPSNGGTGMEDCAGDLRSCLDSPALRKEPALNLGDESSSSSALLWDRPQPGGSDEAHYITTHEIQLYELDHDGECELGEGWDTEESSACSSCRESSSLESEESEASSRTPLGATSHAEDPPATGAVSPGLPVKGARSASALEKRTEDASCGDRLQVSIQTDSQSVSEGNGTQEKGKESLALGPGNQHRTQTQAAGDLVKDAHSCSNAPAKTGAKSNWKTFGNSSGTSSAVSELDDADKEVRSLTARTFRSLACAGDEYLDTFSAGYRTSTDLSDENTALNRCATYIDLKSRSITTGKRGRVGFPSKGANLDTAQGGREQRATGSETVHLPVPGVAVTANEKQETPADQSTSKRQLHLSGKYEQIGSKVITLTETLNFRYDVKEQGPARREGERRVHLAGGVVGLRCTDEVTESALGEEGVESSRESSKPAEAMDGAQKKSKFASNLLQNVIGKKMQFEQELKMERGEITDTSFAGPTSPAAAELPKAPPPSRDVEHNSNGGSSEISPLPVEATGEAAPCETRPATGDSGDGCKSTLHRSQQSAFRSWKDSEPPAPTRESKPAQRVRAEIGGHPLCKETKMSHLFVPSIQKAPGRKQPAVNVTYTSAEGQQRPADGGAEIRIRLGEAKGGRQSPFSIAKLLTPNLAGGASSLGKAASDARGPAPRAEGTRSEDARARAPPFTVRDVRDTMHKLQAPIHQVRDVRKLVKSSYHVSTLDGGGPGVDPAAEQPRGSGAPLPIVIKCQAVSRKEGPEDGSSPAAMKNGSAFVHRTSGRVPLKEATGGGPPGVGARGPGQAGGSPPAASSSQLALEKLTAAVRSMEQLYVFDHNEWRRKSGPGPGPLAGSHVLSLIASQEASDSDAPPGGAEQEQLPAKPPAAARSQARALPKPASGGVRAAVPQLFAVAPVAPQPLLQGAKPTVGGQVGVGSPPPPDLRPSRAQPRQGAEESEKLGQPGAAAGSQEKLPPPEHENYLTIPVKKPPTAPREPSPPAVYQQQHAHFIRLTPPALEPLSPGKVQPVPPVLMDGTSVPCFPVPQPQRRMLLDPATGQYYLVDLPVQPARRRLYDPETGQYVDIPMPQQPVAPMPMSPMALSPGTYGPTFMIYPGFLPQPTVLPALPSAPDTECSETQKGSRAPRLQPEPQYQESPYYFPTGKTLPGSQTTSRGCKELSDGKPVISISSQQGPRIIAPPSFDGTTMSFVVEHR
ncbi:uncharacterized protein C4orf54 homolog [Narcine bancroftii]|uniref:uncharacterized protein C4orf54 homolog n=1 Tax=Narcine bancroftii TaxID=1343680 RepID=UPI003831F30B